MQLDALRREIDEIDAALLPLLRKRLACAREVARYKKARGLPVLNRAREEAILGCLPGANCGGCGYPGCSGYASALCEGSAEDVHCHS